ncbi:MAG TPA: primosomal protein N' (replication factor Y) - superfamily II helicase [Candidatus Xenobia bacterium]
MSLAQTAGKAHRFKCPGCGGDQAFEPRDGFLTCQYCGRKESIPTTPEEVQRHSFADYLKEHTSTSALPASAQQVKCESCGATVNFTPPQVAGECAFCGSKIVTQSQSPDPLVAPEAVLPFKVVQADAAASVRAWLSSRWFAPNSLTKFAQQDALQGVYLPFWSYDAYTVSMYQGQRGEHYFETEAYQDENGNSQTRQVQKTRWWPVSGQVQRWFDDLLIAGTQSLPDNRLQGLEPWDLAALQPYQPDFLTGYKAQRYQVGVEPCFDKAKHRMDGPIRQDVQQAIGGDEQQVGDIWTAYSSVTFRHLLLPLWIGAYRYDGKVYQLMVNARTGQVQGDRPYSIWKIAALVLVILAIIAAIVLSQKQRPHPPHRSGMVAPVRVVQREWRSYA